MDATTTLVLVLLATCAASVTLAITLFAIKVVHRSRLTARAARRDRYIASLGELVTSNAIPEQPPAEWADDPMFLEVVFEYVSILTGQERNTLHELIERLELRNRLSAEVRDSRRALRRLRALIYLVEIAGPGQSRLFHDCLNDPSAEIRLHAARGLAVISDTESIPNLLDLLTRETPWNSGRLADVLVEFGPSAVPALTQYLTEHLADGSGTADAVREVIRAVGLIGDLEAEPVLVDLLAAEEPLSRVGAASALADCGSPACVPPLITALDDADWRVRARAADALATFSDPQTVEPLARRMRDSAWWVRQNAAKALAEIPGGVARLAEALNDDDPFCRDAARFQLGTKKLIRAARHRIESGVGTELDRRIVAASRTTIDDLLEAPGEQERRSTRPLVGDSVVDRFTAYEAESTLTLVERLRRIRRSMGSGGKRFPSLQDVGGRGPFLPGGAGGGGFRPVGGQFTTPDRLAREEARVREALREALESSLNESGT